MTQPVRLSQFVLTYGPGALLEGPNGPRVIPQPDIGLFTGNNAGVTPDALEISDPRMSQGLLGGARLFRLPSNAEFGRPDTWYLYETRPFPSWSLCLNSGAAHGGPWAVLYNAPACPSCGQAGRDAAGQRRQQAIRFVRACAEGHLDDVDWTRVVHRPGTTCTHTRHFRWHGVGGTLAQIRLECPTCGASETLGRAYGREWPCSGRHPEREPRNAPPQRPRGCPESARIVQRQASNLRLPDLLTLFTIPPRDTRLHHLLHLPTVAGMLVTLRTVGTPITESTFSGLLTELAAKQQVPGATRNAILAHPWDEIERAINDVLTPIRTSFDELLDEEFEALRTASVYGAPPVRPSSASRARTARVEFEVNRGDIGIVRGPAGARLRITPVSRLRTVTAQVAYRREVPRGHAGPGGPARAVSVAFTDGRSQKWYPSVELLGEGLFFTLDADDGWHPPLGGPAENWDVAGLPDRAAAYADHLFRGTRREELHPVFVWWHTLAHLLIRSVSIDAGYSSAAVRERVFLDVAAGRARGGVILYATQPGSEGTMGGLIALVPHFQRIIDRALDMARACSNDPLCAEQHFSPGHHNGPACYGCLLVPETSCEHRNLWLDRELLLDNLP